MRTLVVILVASCIGCSSPSHRAVQQPIAQPIMVPDASEADEAPIVSNLDPRLYPPRSNLEKFNDAALWAVWYPILVPLAFIYFTTGIGGTPL